MTKLTRTIITASLVAGSAVLAPAAAANASAPRCISARPASDFYAAGRIASVPVTDNNGRCRTIAVSGIRDAADPSDTCQTFLVALLGAGDPTYTEPVEACAGARTVLATGVPAGTQFRVLYEVDYIDPAPQQVRYKVWY